MVKNLEYYMSLSYTIMVKPLSAEDGGGFLVSIPLLGEDTFTAAGDTLEEALAVLEDVKRDHFIRMLELGIPIPEPDPLPPLTPIPLDRGGQNLQEEG